MFDALVPDLAADKMCFNDLMREKVVKTTRDSCIRGQAGIQNSYRRLKTVLLAFNEENGETNGVEV